MATGRSSYFSLTFLNTSHPSISGIIMSRRIASGNVSSSFLRHSSPLYAVITSNPSVSSTSLTRSTVSGSSSTTIILLLNLIPPSCFFYSRAHLLTTTSIYKTQQQRAHFQLLEGSEAYHQTLFLLNIETSRIK